MNENNQKERKPKSNGIPGSNAVIKQRKEHHFAEMVFEDTCLQSFSKSRSVCLTFILNTRSFEK